MHQIDAVVDRSVQGFTLLWRKRSKSDLMFPMKRLTTTTSRRPGTSLDFLTWWNTRKNPLTTFLMLRAELYFFVVSSYFVFVQAWCHSLEWLIMSWCWTRTSGPFRFRSGTAVNRLDRSGVRCRVRKIRDFGFASHTSTSRVTPSSPKRFIIQKLFLCR